MNWDDPLAPLSNPSSAPSKAPISEEANPLKDAKSAVSAPAPKPDEALTAVSGQEAAIHGQPMHTPAPSELKPVNSDDKRVINGMTDINQLAPFKYPWAWEYFLNANRNHWTPLDINMAQDVHDYHHKLTLEERHVYENVLAYLTTSDILAMRNIGLAVMEKMSAPELQIYQARQVYEEALHTWTYQH